MTSPEVLRSHRSPSNVVFQAQSTVKAKQKKSIRRRDSKQLEDRVNAQENTGKRMRDRVRWPDVFSR